MIISDTFKMVFIHNPKCGGTTVRELLAEFDQTHGAFTERVEEHDVLGLLDYVHIPLVRLKEFFPEEYNKVLQYRSFVLVRDPLEKFLSACSQHFKMYRGTSLKEMSAIELGKQTVQICRHLEGQEIISEPAYIHFEKQRNYVEVDGQQIIDEVIPVSNIEVLLEHVGELVGTKLTLKNSANTTTVYSSEYTKIAVQLLRPLLAPIFSSCPENIKKRLRQIAYKPIKDISLVDDLPDEVKAFVAVHYEQDFLIYQKSIRDFPLPTK